MQIHNSNTFPIEQAFGEPVVSPNVHVMGRRIGATFLDCIPLGILIWLADSTFGIEHYMSSSSFSIPAGIPYNSSTAIALPWLYLLMVTYYTVQEALFSTTIGKFLMGLKVVHNDGTPITFINALVRNSVRPIDAASGYVLGWILALCSSRRRRLGDHLAGTLVVSADSVSTRSDPHSRPWLRLSILTIVCAFFLAFCQIFAYYGRPPLVIQSLTNANTPSSLFANRGTITNLVLGQPTWENNTVTYNHITFHTLNHGIRSNCQGKITLTWTGFFSGWQEFSDEGHCDPAAPRISPALPA